MALLTARRCLLIVKFVLSARHDEAAFGFVDELDDGADVFVLFGQGGHGGEAIFERAAAPEQLAEGALDVEDLLGANRSSMGNFGRDTDGFIKRTAVHRLDAAHDSR